MLWMKELNGGGGDGAQIIIRMLSTSLLQRSCQHVFFHAYLEILFWQDHDWATTATTDSDKELVKILVMDFSGKF
jgi:hypothetical protein